MINEPRLEEIGDYDKLQGEKKRIVWTVIIAGLLIGAVYVYVNKSYGNVEDSIKTTDMIKNIPLKK